MSVAIPIPLLQNLPDVNVSLGVGVDENMLVYDHDTAQFELRAPFAGILATGATVGATSQAQAFTNGISLASTGGVIFTGADRFIHTYAEIGTDGKNTFVGINSGNFTLSRAGGGTDLASYNTGLGGDTLLSLTTGQNNVAVGWQALRVATTGSRNTALGYTALYKLTTAAMNNAVGDAALGKVTSGDGNNAMGYVAGYSLTTGQHNLFIGSNAGYGSDGTNGPKTDNYGILIGFGANRSVASATQLIGYIGIGKEVLIDASYTVRIGNSDITKNYFNGNLSLSEIAGAPSTASSFYTYRTFTDASNYERGVLGWFDGNLLIGTQSAGTGANQDVQFQRNGVTKLSFLAGYVTIHNDMVFSPDATYDIGISGVTRPRDLWLSRNVSIGAAGVISKGADRFIHNYAAAGSHGKNVFVGINSGNFTLGPGGGAADLGSYNTFVGDSTGLALTTGQNNVGMGYEVLKEVTTGSRNIGFGYTALYKLTTASLNNAIGDAALGRVTSGDGNNAFGYVAGYALTTGQQNIHFGSYAGYGTNGTNAPVTDNFGILIGYSANRSVASGTELQSYIGIGKEVLIDASYTARIGNKDNVKTYLQGELSVGEYASSQSFGIFTYQEWVNASNYARGGFSWSSGDLQIGTSALGTGANNSVNFQRNGVTLFSFTNSKPTMHSDLFFATDAASDIGSDGASRPRDLWLSRNASIGGAATITGGIRPAADSITALQLQTVAGASVLNVDTTNARVGIGTTSPGYPLQSVSAGAGASEIVASNTAGAERIHFLSRSSAGVSYIQSQNSQLLVGTYDNFAVQLFTNNVSRIMIDTSGNVGIGDTAPAEKLDVTGNANVTGVYKVDDVQVLSNRVIDARCADVANSGDATTDGLIDALRDAMIAHGLIAASA